uniref:Sodium/hydrogen exchanger n=2 Tax=Rhodosorus marinus TaxID=101924 RepID=A0A7S2ZKC0_9RHOD|mmetsp:Transcript_2140/g.8418  ORF Transcript_2140/g.8418 Transcript_2140/m.8418 type:complete len:571 (+) Transcript_2140:55-1767(+)
MEDLRRRSAEIRNQIVSQGWRTVVILGLAALTIVLSLALGIQYLLKEDVECPICQPALGDYDAPFVEVDENRQEKLGLGITYFILTLCFCVLGSYFLAKNSFTTLPDCIIYVFAGIIVGTGLRLTGRADTAGSALPNQQEFFLFIIPPIIFEAGYSMNKKSFFEEAIPIFLFAVVGTIITALVFGGGIFLVGFFGVGHYFRFYEALTFGSLISAVDPVATIAIFNAMKVNKTLHYLVFGESVLNDAVAIVLYRSFSEMIGPDKPGWYLPVLTFLYIFIGSTVVGITTSCTAAFVLKSTELRKNPTLELSFYLLVAFLPYFICEGLKMSGIMGILIGAMTLGHYGMPNLSETGQLSSNQLFKSIAYCGEAFVFIYLGLALTSFNHSWNVITVLISILLVLISRATNIYPLSFVINRYRRGEKISQKTQFIMWFSGLRGAIAFALSLNFPGGNEETRRVVISSTLAIILFTIIVLGGGTLSILQLLRVEGATAINLSTAASRVDVDRFEEMDIADANDSYIPNITAKNSWIRRLDAAILKPLLTRDAVESMENFAEHEEEGAEGEEDEEVPF